jgi:hypothetical protein
LADPVTFQIEDGVLALAVVDKTESGYQDSWQAPGGGTVDTVTEGDYDAGAASWKCQVTSGKLTPSASTTTTDVPATFCGPARTIPTPGETSYALDAEFLQDVTVKAGLSRFLFEHDTDEAYFLLGLDGDDPPKAIGRVRVQAGDFGGAARTNLTATVSLPLSRKPQIDFGTATDSEVVPPNPGPGAASGATAGTPGAWTPAGATPPATVAALQASSVVANPATAWTTGAYVQTGTAGTGGQAHWDGDSWEAGAAP